MFKNAKAVLCLGLSLASGLISFEANAGCRWVEGVLCRQRIAQCSYRPDPWGPCYRYVTVGWAEGLGLNETEAWERLERECFAPGVGKECIGPVTYETSRYLHCS